MKGSIFGRTFNAKALEHAVLEVLGEILQDWPELEPRLLDHVKQQIASAGQGDELLANKRQQRQDVRDQLLLYVRTLTPKTQADLAPEITRLEAQRDALDAEVEMLSKQRSAANIDPHAAMASLKDRLLSLSADVPSLPPVAMMDVLAQLTDRLEADMDTKDVDFAFHFPAWMLTGDAKTGIAALCTRANSEFPTGTHTHRNPTLFIPLSEGFCRFIRHQRAVSCKCSRSQARRVA